MKKNIFIIAICLISLVLAVPVSAVQTTVYSTDFVGSLCFSGSNLLSTYSSDGSVLTCGNTCGDYSVEPNTFDYQGMPVGVGYHFLELPTGLNCVDFATDSQSGSVVANITFDVIAPAGGGVGIIAIPAGAVADLLDYAGNFFTDLWVIIALVIGIPLGFIIIKKIIGLTKR